MSDNLQMEVAFARYYKVLNNDFRSIQSNKEWALFQLTVCFEFQSRSDRRKGHNPGNGIQKECKKVTVKV